MTALARIADAIDWTNDRIGRAVWWLAVALVLVQFAVVVLRYVFSTSFVAMQESVVYVHATLFMLGIAYTLLHDGHVRVDVFYSGWSPRRRALVDLLGALVAVIPFCVLVLWVCWPYVAQSWRTREGSMAYGGIPFTYLLKTLIPVFAVLLLLQGVSVAIRASLLLAGRGTRVFAPKEGQGGA